MSNEKISSIISIVVAIIVLVASYFQWWDITYNGAMTTRRWIKILFGLLIFALCLSILLII